MKGFSVLFPHITVLHYISGTYVDLVHVLLNALYSYLMWFQAGCYLKKGAFTGLVLDRPYRFLEFML